jgi:eukaryotic-like serine/threonine-protein kinase
MLSERYLIHSLVGEGGMGKVYAAEHVLMHKRVAVKVLHKDLTTMPEVVSRFEREAMAAATIEHPNVAAATDFGRLADGSVYLVLEFIQGISLRSEIASGPFELIRALHVARQIASALASAEARGIVHRDLKPENVMLVEMAGDPDFVKVLDFGIAKVPILETSERGSLRPGQIITKVGTIFGTPEYMAPEQALGEVADGRADQYSLGIVLFEMLTGLRPFRGGSPVGILGQQLKRAPPLLADVQPCINAPPSVDQLIQRMLSVEREQRFVSSTAVVEAIEALQLSLQPNQLIRGSRPDASAGLAALGDGPPSSRSCSRPTWVPPSARDPLLFEPDSARESPQWTRWVARFMPGRLARVVSERTPRVVARLMRASRLRIALLLALIGGLLVGILGMTVGRAIIVSKRGGRPSQSDGAKPRAVGIAALATLAQHFPKEPRVIVELAKVQFAGGNHSGSVSSVAQALAIDATIAGDAGAASLLWKAVQKRECTESAFGLLEGPMGARGADILYDLANTERVRSDIRARALNYFASGQYRARSHPALVVLIGLKSANDCGERQRLVEQASNVGDERFLPVLTALRQRAGCGADGLSDCNPCLRNSGLLEHAIEVIRRRSGG